MHLVDEAARDKEEAALEEGVREDVEGRCRPARGEHGLADLACSESEHHVAELR